MGGTINKMSLDYTPSANILIYDNLKLLQNEGYIKKLTINYEAFCGHLLVTFNLTNQKIGGIDHNFNFNKYQVRLIRNKIIYSPKYFIESPQLKFETPHLNYDRSICLYHPNNYEWREFNPISNTHIPWLFCWVYYYEVWLIEGKWLGPEARH